MKTAGKLTLIAGVAAAAGIGALFWCRQSGALGRVVDDAWLWAAEAGVAVAGTMLIFWLLGGQATERRTRKLMRMIEQDGETGQGARISPWTLLTNLEVAIQRKLRLNQATMAEMTRQRRELEIQMRVSDAARQHTEAILHSISDAVLVTDAFNELAIANEAAAGVLRFDLAESRHTPVDRLITDNALVKLIKDTRESGNTANHRHVEHEIGRGGRKQVYDITLSCVTNPQQEVTGVVTILHDITKEKEISEMKSDFVSSVSHELRTPLSSIKAYVEMLVDGEANDEQTRGEFYNIIQSEANRLSRLIDNILNISRIESGVVKVQRENISLPSVIKEVMGVMLPQARAKQITLTEKASPLYYQILADKDMIYQAVLNLVGNAIKYTPAGGSVNIETEVDDHARLVSVNVTDTGVGIPADAMGHLFEKFFRVADHKKIAKGTGLGLNLVKHIVETVHGGKVGVRSQVGKGSTFSMSLPMDEG